MRLALIGLAHGHVHQILGRKNRRDVDIVGIVEKNRDLAVRVSRLYEFSLDIVFESIEQMIEGGGIHPEAVAAFGSVSEHLEVVEECAPRGIHVMVEKPMALNLDHARRMESLVEKHNIVFLVNYETSWYPTTHRSMELLRSGCVGNLQKVIVCDGHRGPKKLGLDPEFMDLLIDPVKSGGGALMDFACYGANILTWLMEGKRPNSVTAVTQQLQPENNPQVEDDATVVLTYDGVNAVLHASWNWPIGRKDLEIYGTSGVIFAEDRSRLRVRHAKGYDNFDESLYDLEKRRKRPYNDPFAFFAAVFMKKVTMQPFDLSSLENNMIVTEILERARENAMCTFIE